MLYKSVAVVLVLALVFGATCLAEPAAADDPVFAAPRTLAADGVQPTVVIGPAGDATVAWAGRGPGVFGSGVFVARRGVLGGLFSPPVRISDDIVNGVRLSRNLAGAIAVAWAGRPALSDHASLRVAVAPAGLAFGPPETVPLPDRTGVSTTGPATPTDTGLPAVAVAVDGSVSVAVADIEHRVLAAVRPVGGRFGPAQILETAARSDPVVAADGRGSTALLWLGGPSAVATDPSPRSVVRVAERHPGTPFGVPRALSDPDLGAGAPQVSANARGDMLATWPVRDTSVVNGGYSSIGADVAERSLGGPWSAPHRVTAPGKPFSEELMPALNDRGDGVVAAYGPEGSADAVFRPAGQAFAAPVRTTVPPGSSMSGTPADGLGIDALGGTVHAIITGGFRAGLVSAVVRPRTGATRVVLISGTPEATGTPATMGTPAVATDPFGNGLVVWSGGGAIKAATYSATPPLLGGLRVGRREFRFRVSEPAVVQLTVRGAHRRRATQVALARPSANRLRFSARMRRLLKRRGRYTVVARTRDAGPSIGRLKTRVRRR